MTPFHHHELILNWIFKVTLSSKETDRLGKVMKRNSRTITPSDIHQGDQYFTGNMALNGGRKRYGGDVMNRTRIYDRPQALHKQN